MKLDNVLPSSRMTLGRLRTVAVLVTTLTLVGVLVENARINSLARCIRDK